VYYIDSNFKYTFAGFTQNVSPTPLYGDDTFCDRRHIEFQIGTEITIIFNGVFQVKKTHTISENRADQNPPMYPL